MDDDERNLLSARAAFDDQGAYDLVLAPSGRDALLQLLHRDFAVILLDVMMPELDGFETARLIRSRDRNRRTPIIFLTAFDYSEAKVHAGYALGAVDFLFKPVVPTVLAAKVAVFVELYRRTEEVRLLERQRCEAEALRSENTRKDEFLAVLSHELRNPLNTLALALPLLREHGLDPDAISIASAMERQVRHLTRLVDDLLDVGRISSGKILLRPRAISLDEVVDHAVETTASLIDERGHALVVLRPPSRVPLVADPDRIQQIVCNLLSNAARYTDRGGHVELAYGAEEDTAWVRVTDDGRGIAPAALSDVFTRFVQERPVGTGLGLGLAVARQLAELHGGSISAHSDGPGRGARFEVRLPHAKVDASASTDGAVVRPPIVNANALRVMVVDDDEDVRNLTADLFRSHGYEVNPAGNGVEAVEIASRWLPHVILLDLGMPGTDGYETAALLRERLGDRVPPLVAVSGMGADSDRDRTAEAGFAAHLLKPVEPDELLETAVALARGSQRPPKAGL